MKKNVDLLFQEYIVLGI